MADLHDEQLYSIDSLDKVFPIIDVIDNLTSSSTTRPLSANQGRILKSLIDQHIADLASALRFVDACPSTAFTNALTNHTVGDTFVVTTAGTYVGQECNVGDFIICKTTGTASNNGDWIVVESNTPDMVQFIDASTTVNYLPIYKNSNGRQIGNSGVSLTNVVLIQDNKLKYWNGSSIVDITSAMISGLKTQLGIAAIEGNINTINNTISSIQDNIDEIEVNVSNNDADIADIRSQISTINSTISSIQSSISSLQSAVSALTPAEGYELVVVRTA